MPLLARRQAVAVFLVFAFAYFFSALLRAVTATLAPTLTREFGLHAGDLGLLAGGYFLGFAATQLPLGHWLDRYGPKRVIQGFLVIAVAGCGAFAMAGGFVTLLLARVLCGIGVSACLMAALTGYRRWLEPGAQLRANSWMLMTGSLGMLASTLPVQWLLPLVGWRSLFWAFAALIALSIVLIEWQVPRWMLASEAAPTTDGSIAARDEGYRAVWRHPFFRAMTPIGFFSYGGMIAIQTLWAGPWLVRVTGHEPLAAAGGLFTINLSMLLTFWAWGLVNPWLAHRGWSAARLIAWGLPASIVLVAGIVLAGPAAGAATLAVFCVSSTFASLAQPAVAMAFPAALAGRALAAYNLVIFLGIFVVQWGIGLLIDAFAALGLSPVDAFRAAFAAFLSCSVASYAYFLWSKSHNPKQLT